MCVALAFKDGVTWGTKDDGDRSKSVQPELCGVGRLYSTGWAFAAVLKDRTVVTWVTARTTVVILGVCRRR